LLPLSQFKLNKASVINVNNWTTNRTCTHLNLQQLKALWILVVLGNISIFEIATYIQVRISQKDSGALHWKTIGFMGFELCLRITSPFILCPSVEHHFKCHFVCYTHIFLCLLTAQFFPLVFALFPALLARRNTQKIHKSCITKKIFFRVEKNRTKANFSGQVIEKNSRRVERTHVRWKWQNVDNKWPHDKTYVSCTNLSHKFHFEGLSKTCFFQLRWVIEYFSLL